VITGRALNLPPGERLIALQMLAAVGTGKLEFAHSIRIVTCESIIARNDELVQLLFLKQFGACYACITAPKVSPIYEAKNRPHPNPLLQERVKTSAVDYCLILKYICEFVGATV
jgi:hypothetical protein